MNRWVDTIDVSGTWQSEADVDEKMVAAATVFAKFVEVNFSDDEETLMLSEELTDAAEEANVHWFDEVWAGVYDWADYNRIWIKTF